MGTTAGLMSCSVSDKEAVYTTANITWLFACERVSLEIRSRAIGGDIQL